MLLHARARRFADVRADVESLRVVDVFQRGRTARSQLDHFGAGCRIQFFEIRLVDEGDDHQVSARVGIAVEDHERALAAKRDEVLRAVLLSLARCKTHSLLLYRDFR